MQKLIFLTVSFLIRTKALMNFIKNIYFQIYAIFKEENLTEITENPGKSLNSVCIFSPPDKLHRYLKIGLELIFFKHTNNKES